MCGRYVIELSPKLLQKVFGLAEVPELPPRYNVAPTQLVPVVGEASDGRLRLSMMCWGLVPSWSKEIGEGLLTARSESINEKPSFRQTFLQRRCIMVASVFYEWQKFDGKKVPYYIRMADGAPMPFAGLWEAWHSPEGQVLKPAPFSPPTPTPPSPRSMTVCQSFYTPTSSACGLTGRSMTPNRW